MTLYAEPTEAVMRGLTEGQEASFTNLGSTTTGADGCYSIPMDSTSWVNASDVDGRLDLRIMINRPTQIEMRETSIVVTPPSTGGPMLQAQAIGTSDGTTVSMVDSDTSVQGSIIQNFDGTTDQAAIDGDALTTDGSTPNDQAVTSDFANVPASIQASKGVKWKLVTDYGKRSVVVGQWWSNFAGVEDTWKYNKKSSTELGAAFSTSGAVGSFKQSQSHKSTVDATVTWGQVTGKAGELYRTQFKYGKYDLYVYDYITGWYYAGTEIRRTSWERGATSTTGLPVPATDPANCSTYQADSSDDSAVSKAVTWSDGVSLSAPMKQYLTPSVTLSSLTGFTKTAKNHVHFTSKGRLCGLFGPLSHPGALVARPPAS